MELYAGVMIVLRQSCAAAWLGIVTEDWTCEKNRGLSDSCAFWALSESRK